MQELGGQIAHRTEFHWKRIGRDRHGQKVIRLEDGLYFVGSASGDGCNCLINSLLQCINWGGRVHVKSVRRSLMREFSQRCGPQCNPLVEGAHRPCRPDCMRVVEGSYLLAEHWSAVLRLMAEQVLPDATRFRVSEFQLRVIELTWEDHGDVLGERGAPRRFTIARTGRNHFVPVLPYRTVLDLNELLPW